jgi:hypothetical protein
MSACASLWQLEPTSATAAAILPTLIDLVASSDRGIRMLSMNLLLSLGPEAAPAEPQLRKLLRHERREVRQIAAAALRKLAESP